MTKISGSFISVLFLGLLVCIGTPSPTFAYERYSERTKDAIESLDEDAVDIFPVPVLFGVIPSKIVSDFGDVRGGGTRTHEGQDIRAILGTPIVTPTEAVVTDFGYDDMPGNYVNTSNPGGESFRYMHLDSIADLKIGDTLKVGGFIGTVGDTGNAKGAGAHLHFEVRKATATDPLPRIQKEFTLKDKMKFVNEMFDDLDDEEEMAKFLVDTYPQEFNTAQDNNYELPEEIEELLTPKEGSVSTAELVKKLDAIIVTIPSVLRPSLTVGSKSVEVSLLQVFLIHQKVGVQGEFLARSGATGYFGTVTKAALQEYQKSHDIEETGLYDLQTQKEMMRR